MNSHLTAEQLDDFVDGGLSPAEQAHCSRHIEGCSQCQAEVEGLRRLLARVHALPAGVRPPRDLLAQVHAAIDAQQVRPLRAAGHQTLWSLRWPLAAAALVLIIATALITRALSHQGIQLQPAIALSPPGATLVGTELRGLEQTYVGAIAELQSLIDSNQAELSPETRALLAESLRIIDRAIRESRSAAQQNPANQMVNQMLRSAYEKKLDLLRRATAVTAT